MSLQGLRFILEVDGQKPDTRRERPMPRVRQRGILPMKLKTLTCIC